MQNLVVVSHTLCAHVRGYRNWGIRWNPTLGIGAWLTLRKHVPAPLCYNAKFSRSMSNHIGVSRCLKKICDTGTPPLWDRIMMIPSPTRLIVPIPVILRETVGA